MGKAEGGRRKAEGGRRKAEGGRRKAEGGGRRQSRPARTTVHPDASGLQGTRDVRRVCSCSVRRVGASGGGGGGGTGRGSRIVRYGRRYRGRRSSGTDDATGRARSAVVCAVSAHGGSAAVERTLAVGRGGVVRHGRHYRRAARGRSAVAPTHRGRLCAVSAHGGSAPVACAVSAHRGSAAGARFSCTAAAAEQNRPTRTTLQWPRDAQR
jgi:hypothetical protein